MKWRFKTRYFNTIEAVEHLGLVRKISKDNAKLLSEHDYWYELPDDIKHYFVQPFSFILDGEVSYYYMEHYKMPNVAEQMLSGELSNSAFDRLIQKLHKFRQVLPDSPALDSQVDENARYLVLEKTKERIDELKGSSWDKSNYAITLAEKDITPEKLYEQLVEKFETHYANRTMKRIYLSHGDLVLSNILYDDRLEIMKFVDPKGKDFMYLDEYYDFAKMSQSILGNYEDIVYGNYELNVETEKLIINRSDDPHMRTAFKRFFMKYDIDYKLLRVYEASLFLSMMPLHLDDHKRMAAFLLCCKRILKVV